MLLMKVDVVINKKKKLRKLGTYSIQATEIQAGSNSKPDLLNLSAFHC